MTMTTELQDLIEARLSKMLPALIRELGEMIVSDECIIREFNAEVAAGLKICEQCGNDQAAHTLHLCSDCLHLLEPDA